MTSIAPERLIIGLYIHLDHSWREHPFLRSSFQITSLQDIESIREQGLTRISVDPERSSPEALRSLEQASESEEAASSDASEPQPQIEPNAREVKGVGPEEAKSHQEQDEVSTSIGEITTEMRREAIYKSKGAYSKAIVQGRAMHNIMAENPEKGLTVATEMVASLLENIGGDIAAMSHAKSTNPQDEALMRSLNVSAISTVLGRDFGLSHDDLSSMGLGVLLLSLGTETMEKLPPVSDSVSEVIKHCKKKPNGSGSSSDAKDSPKGIVTEIVSVVQAYDDLTNSNSTTETITPTDALSHLYKNMTDERSREIVTALICSMTIYPPGSFVHLTDNSIAMVISPNPENRMKPFVMLYDPTVPNDQATFLDLAKEDDISIQQQVSRKVLPPEIIAYLNPTKVNGYSISPT